MYSKKEREKEEQGELFMEMKEEESFQEAVINSDNFHWRLNKMRGKKGLLDLPVPRSLTALPASVGAEEWGLGV